LTGSGLGSHFTRIVPAGKPIIFDHFYLTAGKKIVQLFRTREIGDSEEIKVKLNHFFVISMLTDIMFFKWVKSCDA
jgi:hypothetical protein